MLYHLALWLTPDFSVANVLLYHTVRAGGAAFTGFIFCLIMGPRIIRLLQALKVGQFIKEDHVADLHALHQGKSGTPTMGGLMMIISTVLSLLIWSTLTNRLMWLALFVFILLGLVGFLDDYIKLKRKHNDGLSARAKLIGQILAGGILGIYLYLDPITISANHVHQRDVLNWNDLVHTLVQAEQGSTDPVLQKLWTGLEEPVQQMIRTAHDSDQRPVEAERISILKNFQLVLNTQVFYGVAEKDRYTNNIEVAELLNGGIDTIGKEDMLRLNRIVLESHLPIAASVRNLHTKVSVPGFKDLFIPLGIFFIPFIICIIVSISNAVNLTDGLDGLATGTSMISIFAFTAIAYIVSRADWSSYLYLTYIPEASELFVFGGALLGTGMGFLWFNAHPAEVFMGDTGSLALGGAMGTMAILTKQELLLPIVAGLFVMEAASVVIQVASYKLTGKRVFRMAPLHHHFELLGWSETKVTIRFWIIAFIFALLSLSTLKLR